jgi:excisionase family DNA binding protein
MDHNERVALSVPDAARAAAISRSKLYEYIAGGGLRSFRLGGRRLILKRDLVAFLETAREGG